MSAIDIGTWQFDRETAARIAGVTDAQLRLWISRNNLFSWKKAGTGRAMSFDLSNIFDAAGVRVLIDHGLSVGEAVDAVSTYGLYGCFLHDPASLDPAPGTFFLSKNKDGRWVGVSSAKNVMEIRLRTWAIFDDLWPRFEAAFKAVVAGKSYEADAAAALKRFNDQVKDIRKVRWGK